MSDHLCHARGCKTPVPPRRLMCAPHWRMVPKRLQDAVWGAYAPGQEARKDPTSAYLTAAMDAVRAVAALEQARSDPPGALFDGYDPVVAPPEPELSADRRRTVRREADLARGVHPTTKVRLLPAERGLTCDGCAHCDSYDHHNRSYVKCDAVRLTHGPGSDTRRKWPACERFEARS